MKHSSSFVINSLQPRYTEYVFPINIPLTFHWNLCWRWSFKENMMRNAKDASTANFFTSSQKNAIYFGALEEIYIYIPNYTWEIEKKTCVHLFKISGEGFSWWVDHPGISFVCDVTPKYIFLTLNEILLCTVCNQPWRELNTLAALERLQQPLLLYVKALNNRWE